MVATEGEFERVDVREKWPNESLHFTRWLAKNLDLLGDAIGMKLELVQREKIVGSMFLDILAKDVETGRLVAIENLYGWTDIDHLGRLFIYAAGCNAPVLILIAEEFAYEHAQTLHQMNEWSKEEVSFYGVKVQVIRKAGESDPEPRFRNVVYPGGWDEGETAKPDAVHPDILKHRRFFQPMVDELRWMDMADNPVNCWDFKDRMFRSRVNQLSGYVARLSGKTAWVYLHIRTCKIELTNTVYDELLAQRDEIERGVGASLKWDWDRSDKRYFSSISVKRNCTIDDPLEKLDEIRAWMLEMLPKFKQVFDPLMAEILPRLSPP